MDSKAPTDDSEYPQFIELSGPLLCTLDAQHPRVVVSAWDNGSDAASEELTEGSSLVSDPFPEVRFCYEEKMNLGGAAADFRPHFRGRRAGGRGQKDADGRKFPLDVREGLWLCGGRCKSRRRGSAVYARLSSRTDSALPTARKGRTRQRGAGRGEEMRAHSS